MKIRILKVILITIWIFAFIIGDTITIITNDAGYFIIGLLFPVVVIILILIILLPFWIFCLYQGIVNYIYEGEFEVNNKLWKWILKNID